jgi:hypothetical protein
MDRDYSIRYGRMYDDTQYNLDRSTTRVKVCEFWIGNSGPFVERIADGPSWGLELAERIEALRAKMRTLPQ